MRQTARPSGRTAPARNRDLPSCEGVCGLSRRAADFLANDEAATARPKPRRSAADQTTARAPFTIRKLRSWANGVKDAGEKFRRERASVRCRGRGRCRCSLRLRRGSCRRHGRRIGCPLCRHCDRGALDRDILLERRIKKRELRHRCLRSVFARDEHVLKSLLAIEADGIAGAGLELFARRIRPPSVGVEQKRAAPSRRSFPRPETATFKEIGSPAAACFGAAEACSENWPIAPLKSSGRPSFGSGLTSSLAD